MNGELTHHSRVMLLLLPVTMGAITLPHAPHLPWWALLLAAGTGLWWSGQLIHHGRLPQLTPGMKSLLVLAGFGLVALQWGRHPNRDAGVTLLTVMLFFKMVELRNQRDIFLVVIIGFFLLLTNFIYSQEIWLGLYLMVTVLLLVTLMIGLSRPAIGSGGEQPALTPHAALRMASVMLAQALPVMVVMFLLFPRLPGPLWGTQETGKDGAARTGLSDTLELGSISKLALSHAVALRVEFADTPPPRPQRYWRGPVLWNFDGTTWSGLGFPLDPQRVVPLGERLSYQITLEPNPGRWLIALELPFSAPRGARLTGDHQLLTRHPNTVPKRYQVVSYPMHRPATTLPGPLRRLATDLPPGSNPKTRELAASLRGESPTATVTRVLEYLRSNPFFYTLTPPRLSGSDRIDQFLFESRRGFCEHYATAFTYLMRAVKIPARIVLGYQGGELNPLTGQLTILQSDAHAWSEVWLEERGWTRVDPTAAIAPQRVERGSSVLDAEQPLFDGWLGGRLPFQDRLWVVWDAVNTVWNGMVLGYGPTVQKDLLSFLKLDRLDPLQLGVAGAAVILAILAAWLGVMLRPGRRDTREPIRWHYEQFCHKLARHGVERNPWEGPSEFARRAITIHPEWEAWINGITRRYVGLRYGKRPRPQDAAMLKQLVKEFRRATPRRRGP